MIVRSLLRRGYGRVGRKQLCSPIVSSENFFQRQGLDGRASFSSASAGGTGEVDIHTLEYRTLHELRSVACATYPENELFGTYMATPNGDGGEFRWMTYREFDNKVSQCRSVLNDMGIREHDRVGLISNNRWEWAALTCAAHSLNATVVPMYEAQRPSDWMYILNDSLCSALICSTPDVYHAAVREVVPSTPALPLSNVLCLDAKAGEDHALVTHMKRFDNETLTTTTTAAKPPSPDDLANLIYTSGTTGRPKGVELLHSNIVSNVQSVWQMVEEPRNLIKSSDRSLAFLPWAHSYGQTCELWCFMVAGASMGICRGVPSILEDLTMVQPTTLFSVPTLYKKVYDGVNNAIESASPLKKALMKKAFVLGRARSQRERRRQEQIFSSNSNAEVSPPLEQPGFVESLQLRVLDSLVLSKVRDRFGGRLRQGFCAGAAVPREVLNFMDDIGIPVCEGYGLTETSPIIALSVPEDGGRKVGSVGRPLKGVDVVLVNDDGHPVSVGEEGEICCRGPNVMRGYHNNREATAEVFSGGTETSPLFHTGDLGRLGADGFLYVTGRKKELYKLENGKYVCPTPIEEAIGMSRFLTQVVLCGANRPHNVCLLVPDFMAVRQFLGATDQETEEDLVNDSRFRPLVDAEIRRTCADAGIKKFEVPKAWAVVAPFTAANNMLTPKMSIRRHVVVKTYEDVVEGLYDTNATKTNSTSSTNDEMAA